MIVVKGFKTVNQVFTVGQEFYENFDGLENWVSGDFVALETFVENIAVPVPVPTPVPPAATEVPVTTFA